MCQNFIILFKEVNKIAAVLSMYLIRCLNVCKVLFHRQMPLLEQSRKRKQKHKIEYNDLYKVQA